MCVWSDEELNGMTAVVKGLLGTHRSFEPAIKDWLTTKANDFLDEIKWGLRPPAAVYTSTWCPGLALDFVNRADDHWRGLVNPVRLWRDFEVALLVQAAIRKMLPSPPTPAADDA